MGSFCGAREMRLGGWGHAVIPSHSWPSSRPTSAFDASRMCLGCVNLDRHLYRLCVQHPLGGQGFSFDCVSYLESEKDGISQHSQHLSRSTVEHLQRRPRFEEGRRLCTQPDSLWYDKGSTEKSADSDVRSFNDLFDVEFDHEDDERHVAASCEGLRNEAWNTDSPLFRCLQTSREQQCIDVSVPNCSSCSLKAPFNQFCFARVYDLVALQVPLAESQCFAYRLKGHLLNWPQISNIATVHGDDMDWETKMLLSKGKEVGMEGMENSLLRAVYGTSAEIKDDIELRSCGFQQLERMSRPRRRFLKKRRLERETDTRKRSSKALYKVEVPGTQKGDLNSATNLQSMTKWIGPSRLLLLDTKYVGKSASELPMAVQALLNEASSGSKREILPCKLTLFYDYWPMKEIIKSLVSPGEVMPLAIKSLGHIACLSLGRQYFSVKHLIGRVILDKYRPKVKTVINEIEQTEGRCHSGVEVLAGNHSIVTTICENGIVFHINLGTVYWDWELSLERQRLVDRFCKKDVVCDVFAGAGFLVLPSAKKVWRVFANEVGAEALKYLNKNVTENKLQAKVEVYNLDGRLFIKKLLSFRRPVLITQLVFSLPTVGEEFLDALKGAFRRQTWPETQPLPKIHVYGYSNASDAEKDFQYRIVSRLGLPPGIVEVCRVKAVGVGMWLVYASFQLPMDVAYEDSIL